MIFYFVAETGFQRRENIVFFWFFFYIVLLYIFLKLHFKEEFTFMSWICLTVVAKLFFLSVFRYVDQVTC